MFGVCLAKAKKNFLVFLQKFWKNKFENFKFYFDFFLVFFLYFFVQFAYITMTVEYA